MKHSKIIAVSLLTSLTVLSTTQSFAQQKVIEDFNKSENTQKAVHKVNNPHIDINSIEAGILYDKYTDPDEQKQKPVLNQRNTQYINYQSIEAGRLYDKYTHASK